MIFAPICQNWEKHIVSSKSVEKRGKGREGIKVVMNSKWVNNYNTLKSGLGVGIFHIQKLPRFSSLHTYAHFITHT